MGTVDSRHVVDTSHMSMTTTEPNRKPEGEFLWTTSDVARFLGCSERQVYLLRAQGLPTIHVGSMVRFDPEQVRLWVGTQDSAASSADERARQLADIATSGSEDNAECAAADLGREFPSSL